MEIRPILSAMLRNKTGAVLIALQIAFTLAVVVNAVFIVGQRVEKMTRPTGMDIANMIKVQAWAMSPDRDFEAMVDADLEVLRAIPGVVAATATQQIPLSGGGWGDTVKAAPAEDSPDVGGARYQLDEAGMRALGLTLEAGRWFLPSEIFYREPNSAQPVAHFILTRAMADELFPDGQEALGATIYDGLLRPAKVVGIIEHMQGAWVNWDKLNNVIISPEVPSGPLVRYIVRAEPGQRDLVMPQVEEVLVARDRGRVVRKLQAMEDVVAHSYQRDRAMAVVLSVVVGLLVVITSLGIVGLASLTVKQRTKQIGTRRAVGARKIDIVRYFLTENWLITSIGVALGSILALGANYWLVTIYSLDKLPPVAVPVGIMALWALGLLSVLGPARRAADIAPAIATRTV